MYILGINTATEKSNIILWNDGQTHEVFYSTNFKTYGENLLINLEFLLKMSNWTLNNIDLYCVVTGPGSFTGLRIGAVTVKTLAQIYKKPIVGISYLEGLAYQTVFNGVIGTILPGRKGEIHTGFFENLEKFNNISSEEIYSYQNFTEVVKNLIKERELLLVGSIPEDLKKILPKQVKYAPIVLNSLKGETLVLLGLEKYKKGDFKDYLSLLPDYRQKSSAEVNWIKKYGGTKRI
ncbi:MAG TPA: tRNA (adenosine(37)-N6)-threonylcarbamoyltransferase complex dimerization subunit type 1 TsaB [Dictyoglomaceae bacterium]|nr:tRNA (adenosine(37)-N6)-threonylcarbamoyltransferase complex dimerization subunit type 1 TsaB [Dictyoglomaceae bacterium]